MIKFIESATPRDLDTFAADVERVEAQRSIMAVGAYVVTAETTTAEGYSVPVRLTLDRERADQLRQDITPDRWHAHNAFCRARAALVFAQNAMLAARTNPGVPEWQGVAQWSPERLHEGGDEYLRNGDMVCVCDKDPETFSTW